MIPYMYHDVNKFTSCTSNPKPVSKSKTRQSTRPPCVLTTSPVLTAQAMFSWLGIDGGANNRHSSNPDLETTPLLDPESAAETQLQAGLYSKLHTYLLLRALSKGYLPSTIQASAHLRALLDTDVLNPSNTQLTPSGRRLVRDVRTLISLVAAVLETKNGRDQLQEFLWLTRRAKLGFDGGELVDAAGNAVGGLGGSAADMVSGYGALHTVADLLMSNADFRKLAADVTVLGRQVLADAAVAGGEAAKGAGETVRPTQTELENINKVEPASDQDFDLLEEEPADSKSPMKDVGQVVVEGVVETAEAALESAQKELQDEGRGNALLERMKMVVLRLRGRDDYTQSVGIISVLLKRYALLYSRSVSAAASTATDGFKPNGELDMAVQNFWGLLTSFGDRAQWKALENQWHRLLQHLNVDSDLETLLTRLRRSRNGGRLCGSRNHFASQGVACAERRMNC